MNRVAWAAVSLALRWASATDDQIAYPVLKRAEAELWKLNHPPRPPGAPEFHTKPYGGKQ